MEQTNLKMENGKGRLWQNSCWPLLAFVIPFVLVWGVFAHYGVEPFGDKTLLVSDAWHQYFAFLTELQAKLKSGDSLLYTWNGGLGTNFVALAAYYCASPLNLLTLLVPTESLRVAYTMLVSLKIGAAGAFCGIFLQKTFGRKDVSVTVFGCFYALCAYIMGYYWNIMWMDTVALLPLVALGLVALVREGKWKLYVISLALSLFCNYVIGLYVCIFVFFAFFLTCFGCGLDLAGFKKRFLQIAVYTVLSIILTAILLLPTLMALSNSNSAGSTFPSVWKLKESFADVFANFSAFAAPTSREGLPNLYTGLPCVLLSVLFLTSGKISWRRKLSALSMLVLLMVSLNVNVLEYMWNGFHVTNMLPYRFSFLVSFTLVVMAFQAVPEILSMTPGKWLQLGVVALLLLPFTWTALGTDITLGNAGFIAAYFLCLLVFGKAGKPRKVLVAAGLCLIICAELLANTLVSVKSVRVVTSVGYPKNGQELSVLLDELEADTDFYRVECMPYYTLNDPALLGYRGISTFSSVANVNVTRFMERVGVAAQAAGNRYYSTHVNSPVLNAMFSLKYMLLKGMEPTDTLYLQPISEQDSVTAYENSAWLPVGFMAEPEMGDALPQEENPFALQNSLFSAATGNPEDVFELVNLTDVGHRNLLVVGSEPGRYTYNTEDSEIDASMKYNYLIPRSGLVYAYVDCDDATSVSVSRGNENRNFGMDVNKPYAFCAGYFEAGERVSFLWNVAPKDSSRKADMELYVAVLNDEVFDAGLAALADEGLQVESFTSDSITGTIDVKEDGYFYTSIPYEKGWTLYVDGVKAEITPYENAFVALENLPAGTHRIELKYMPAGLVPGIALSGLGLLLFCGLCLWERKKRIPAAPAPQQAAQPAAEHEREAEVQHAAEPAQPQSGKKPKGKKKKKK